jgi:hypothetical protein
MRLGIQFSVVSNPSSDCHTPKFEYPLLTAAAVGENSDIREERERGRGHTAQKIKAISIQVVRINDIDAGPRSEVIKQERQCIEIIAGRKSSIHHLFI